MLYFNSTNGFTKNLIKRKKFYFYAIPLQDCVLFSTFGVCNRNSAETAENRTP